MYYVIYVGSGKEVIAERYIESTVNPDTYEFCFHPEKHLRKRFHGEWSDLYEILLPGYIFVKTDCINEFYVELKNVPIFLRLLDKHMEYNELVIYPIYEEEERWLERLIPELRYGDDSDYVVEISEVGFDVNDKVTIVSGPLLGMEGYIKKINLHKRIAEVEVQFMNQTSVIYLGIDILEKES